MSLAHLGSARCAQHNLGATRRQNEQGCGRHAPPTNPRRTRVPPPFFLKPGETPDAAGSCRQPCSLFHRHCFPHLPTAFQSVAMGRPCSTSTIRRGCWPQRATLLETFGSNLCYDCAPFRRPTGAVLLLPQHGGTGGDVISNPDFAREHTHGRAERGAACTRALHLSKFQRAPVALKEAARSFKTRRCTLMPHIKNIDENVSEG